MKLYKDEKIAAMNAKMHNGFTVNLTAYYMHKEKTASIEIPFGVIEEGEHKGEPLILLASAYYAYDKKPSLSVGCYYRQGDWLKNYAGTKYYKLCDTPQRRDFGKIQRYTLYLEKDKLIQFFQKGVIDLPRWEEV